jgi:hypothetical protein
LTALDLSKNAKLTELDARDNYISGENDVLGVNKSKLVMFKFDPQKDKNTSTSTSK